MEISIDTFIEIAKWVTGVIGSIATVGAIPLIKYRVKIKKEEQELKKSTDEKFSKLLESVDVVKMMVISTNKKLSDTAMLITATIETSPHAYFICDGHGLCIMANDACLRLFNSQLSEMLGLGWITFLHPDHRNRVRQNWVNTVESKNQKIADHYPIIDKQLYDTKGEIEIKMNAAYKAIFQYKEEKLESAVATIWSIEEDRKDEAKRNKAFDCIIETFTDIKKTDTWAKIQEEIKQKNKNKK